MRTTCPRPWKHLAAVIACICIADLSFALSSPDLPSCLDSIGRAAGEIATGTQPFPSPTFIEDDRTFKGWVPSANGNGEWVQGSLRARNPDGTTGVIIIYPATWETKAVDCSPRGLAEAFKYLAHEVLHDVCPEHTPSGGPPMVAGTSGERPEGPAPKPDCNDLNYAMHTADAICSLISIAAECLADCPKEDVCPPLKSPGGTAIEGTDTCDKIRDLCSELSKAHQGMQDKYNSPENAATAFACKCGAPPWSPGGTCPAMPNPPDGCKASAAETYPGNEIIPDCSVSCP